MLVAAIAVVVVLTLTILACCKVSGNCSRSEEKFNTKEES